MPSTSPSAPAGPHGSAGGRGSPVPEDARVELERVARRWRELSLAEASGAEAGFRSVLAGLAVRCGADVVPELGPAAVTDQLAVLVWDAYAAGRGDGIPALLSRLRRDLP